MIYLMYPMMKLLEMTLGRAWALLNQEFYFIYVTLWDISSFKFHRILFSFIAESHTDISVIKLIFNEINEWTIITIIIIVDEMIM